MTDDINADHLDQIKHLLTLVGDKIGQDSSLRWLIKEVNRLREQQEAMADELKILYTLLEKMVTRLGEAFAINPVSIDPEQLTEMVAYRYRGLLSEQTAIHDLAAEVLGYQRAPSLEEDPNCPCPGDFMTGEHTAQTLVMALVSNYKAVVHNNKILLDTLDRVGDND